MRNINIELSRYQTMLGNQIEQGVRITSRQSKYLKKLKKKANNWKY